MNGELRSSVLSNLSENMTSATPGNVTDKKGEFYEHTEYTSSGESWVNEKVTGNANLPFKYTSKEQDSETGLYYHGARYRDARTGVWLSCDPYLERYLPTGNKEKNKNLPADGIFRVVNMNLYHYAGNNPVKYVDPDGNKIVINGDLAYKKAMQNVLISIAPGAKIDMKTGVVSMDSKVSQRHFKKGTELMSKLVSDPHTVTISPTAGDPQANAINLSGASNPLVGSDTNIDFDPKKSIDLPTLIGKKTAVDKKTHPVIVLSHELIHALDNAEGIRNPKLISNYLGLHGVNVDATWMPGGGVKTNELTTVGLPGYNQKYGITENSIRKEQGLNPRPYY